MSVATMRRYIFPARSDTNESGSSEYLLAMTSARHMYRMTTGAASIGSIASSDVGRQVGREEYQADGQLVDQRDVDEGDEFGDQTEEAAGGTREDEEGHLLPRAGGASRLSGWTKRASTRRTTK